MQIDYEKLCKEVEEQTKTYDSKVLKRQIPILIIVFAFFVVGMLSVYDISHRVDTDIMQDVIDINGEPWDSFAQGAILAADGFAIAIICLMLICIFCVCAQLPDRIKLRKEAQLKIDSEIVRILTEYAINRAEPVSPCNHTSKSEPEQELNPADPVSEPESKTAE